MAVLQANLEEFLLSEVLIAEGEVNVLWRTSGNWLTVFCSGLVGFGWLVGYVGGVFVFFLVVQGSL